jgi:hypothetical protein
MRDPFKVAVGLVVVTAICLIAPAGARAQDAKSGEIIEQDFFPAAATYSLDDQAAPPPDSALPPVDPPIQLVPTELIGDVAPADMPRRADGGGESGGTAAAGSGNGGSGGGDGSGGSGAGSGGGDSGGSGSGGNGNGGGHGNGHGKGGSKK